MNKRNGREVNNKEELVKEPARKFDTVTTNVEGTVLFISETGIKIGDKWYSKSKYHVVPGLGNIQFGDKVKLMIDSRDYILRAKILEVADF